MPEVRIGGIGIYYEVLGDHGPWVALLQGGRHDVERIRPMADRLALAGHRVLIHDRRICGRSDLAIDGSKSEFELCADDLFGLLGHLSAAPAFIGGTSAGCRVALLLALRHPGAVRGLMLWRPSGGPIAARILVEEYYGGFIAAARQGGMAAVCATEFFQARIDGNPSNRDRLMAMDAAQFIDVFSRWRRVFDEGADLPVIGFTEPELASVTVPACIMPGNDGIHPRRIGLNLHRLIQRSEIHEIAYPDLGKERITPEEWADEGRAASVMIDFIKRLSAVAS